MNKWKRIGDEIPKIDLGRLLATVNVETGEIGMQPYCWLEEDYAGWCDFDPTHWMEIEQPPWNDE